eukprot:m.24370 g.24370  ORF g.24370 m.24370 type:complete len:421 (+) comp14577_c0_seq1:44-1306(+)
MMNTSRIRGVLVLVNTVVVCLTLCMPTNSTPTTNSPLSESQLALLPTWSWDKMSTWCFPTFANLPLTDDQIDWYSKFDMVDNCCSGLRRDEVTNDYLPTAVNAAINISKTLKAHKPTTFYSPYIGMEMGQNWYGECEKWNHLVEFAPQWLTYKNGTVMTCNNESHTLCALLQLNPQNDTKVYDWRAPGMIDYFVNNISGVFWNDSNVDGIFFDDIYTICEWVSSGVHDGWFDPQDAIEFCDASFKVLAATADAGRAANKLPILSIKGDETNMTVYNISKYRDVILEHGGMVYFEYWNNWPSQPRQESLLELAMDFGSRGVPMQMHASVMHNCIGNVTGNFTDWPVATFLLAAGEHSYFSIGSGWNPGLEQSLWLPVYDQPLGKPLGLATQIAPHVWTREFEGVSVWVNMSDCNATKITYK